MASRPPSGVAQGWQSSEHRCSPLSKWLPQGRRLQDAKSGHLHSNANHSLRFCLQCFRSSIWQINAHTCHTMLSIRSQMHNLPHGWPQPLREVSEQGGATSLWKP